MNNNTAGIRKDYVFNEKNELNGSTISKDPFTLFQEWFDKALESDPSEANAMSLATSTKDGKPSVRTVLLKGFDKNGFLFFTNYHSRKGKELEENPYASLLFFWRSLERQIRISGKTEKVSREDSEIYFHSRPYDSQIAALCSDQSSVIPDRKYLDEKFISLKEKFNGNEIPLPAFWGGFRLIPDNMEFWQGRQNRLHDRILFTKENNNWKTARLSP
ncbi:MAG TPA: pyridoxamine 5'-phosphate oxidase [Ignavibacteria bacterium]|nr:pyridoxamine 5'-phosphate oxidase [Ignavibacteria bacterium]HMR40161.1 pyridoxamine 5'-phosphate oxidase [Ignavibacteria bacterium]